MTSLAFSADGKTLASGSADQAVKLWDARTGDLQRTLAGQTVAVRAVAVSPDGTEGHLLASGGGDHHVRLWEGGTGRLLRELVGHTGGVNALGFSPDGKLLASGSAHPPVLLWSPEAGKVQRRLIGHTGAVTSVAFAPDGRTLAAAGWDNSVRLWDARSGRLMVTLWMLPFRKEGAASTGWIAVTPAGYYDGAEGAESFIRWRAGNRLLPGSRYRSIRRRPRLLQKALQRQPESGHDRDASRRRNTEMAFEKMR